MNSFQSKTSCKLKLDISFSHCLKIAGARVSADPHIPIYHENTGQHPTNTPRGFHVETTWKRVSTLFQRGIHVVCLYAIFLHILRGEYLHLSQFFFYCVQWKCKSCIFFTFCCQEYMESANVDNVPQENIL